MVTNRFSFKKGRASELKLTNMASTTAVVNNQSIIDHKEIEIKEESEGAESSQLDDSGSTPVLEDEKVFYPGLRQKILSSNSLEQSSSLPKVSENSQSIQSQRQIIV